MIRQPVSSSRIVSVGWKDDNLEVEFPDGKVYQYENVTLSEYNSFMRSTSLGHALSVLDKQHHYHPVR